MSPKTKYSELKGKVSKMTKLIKGTKVLQLHTQVVGKSNRRYNFRARINQYKSK